jgi:23S rRNA pseudouridine1911/1915/1917 synthase
VTFGSGWPIHPRVSVLWLDESLAIVNKGAGLLALSAVDGDLSAQSILGDFLSGDLKAKSRDIDVNALPPFLRRLRPLPVHRLDQYTSGVFCMATNGKARQHLIEQLKAHSMSREYVAFAQGRASAPSGVWRNWLQLTRDELRQQIISDAQAKSAGDDAREAITHFEVIREFEISGGRFVTQLKLRLETGRKHQIRIQAAHAGLPLIGDRAYNPFVRRGDPSCIDFPRQALHAMTLSLEHPDKPGTRMSWTAQFPKDLRELENAARSGRL